MVEQDLTQIIEQSIQNAVQKAFGAHVRPRLLSVEQTSAYLGLAQKTIRNGLGPKATDPFPVKPKRIGGRVLFDIRDLDRYIDGLGE